jgi:hypothetical protein
MTEARTGFARFVSLVLVWSCVGTGTAHSAEPRCQHRNVEAITMKGPHVGSWYRDVKSALPASSACLSQEEQEGCQIQGRTGYEYGFTPWINRTLTDPRRDRELFRVTAIPGSVAPFGLTWGAGRSATAARLKTLGLKMTFYQQRREGPHLEAWATAGCFRVPGVGESVWTHLVFRDGRLTEVGQSIPSYY